MGVIRQKQIVIAIFAIWAVSWMIISLFFSDIFFLREFWSDTYGIIALLGGIFGLINVRACGGIKSLLGRPLLFFSVGLLLQEFGQIMYIFYSYIWGVEMPYPSLGDIGFFFGPVLYAIGTTYFWKTVRSFFHVKWHSLNGLLVFFAVLALASFSWLFGNGHGGALRSSWFELLLEIGYLLVGAFYLSLVFMLNFSSPERAVGIFESSIRITSFALVVQYLADYVFSFQFYENTWQTAGVNEAMYFVAYFLMTLNIIKLRSVFENTQVVVGLDGETRDFFNSGIFKSKSAVVSH